MFPKPEKKKKPKQSLKALFLRVWNSRPHICQKCGAELSDPLLDGTPWENPPRAHNFAHIKHRGMGGNPDGSRNVESNILILCYACHKEMDTGRRPKNAEWLDR